MKRASAVIYPATVKRSKARVEKTEEEEREIVLQYMFTTFIFLEDETAVLKFLSKGYDVNKPDETGLTPLVYAINHGRATMTRLLLENGADPNKHKKGKSTLAGAVYAGMDEIVDVLLEYGAKVDLGELIDASDKAGRRVLHKRFVDLQYAVSFGGMY